MQCFRIDAGHMPEEILAAARNAAIPEDEDVLFTVCGEVPLSAPIRIKKDALFNDIRRVTFAGEPGAVLSGGVRVNGFTSCGGGLWSVKLPDVSYTRTLYVDGKAAPRPTTEKRKTTAWDVLQGECEFYQEGDEITGLVTTDRTLLTARNVRDIEMIFNVGWTHHVIPIESVKELPDGRVFIRPLLTPFLASVERCGVAIGGCPSWFENVYERLANPGEWYFDTAERTLYLLLAENDTPAAHTVEIPLCDQLLTVEGTAEDKAGNILFRNITFRNAGFTRPHEYGYSDLQAGIARRASVKDMPKREKPYEMDGEKLIAAVRLVAARQVDFVGCTFTCLASTALWAEYGSEDCTVDGCLFTFLGAGAIMIGDLGAKDDIRVHHPADPRETVRRIAVRDCTVSYTGQDFCSTVAVMLGYVADCTVEHNLIHDVPYSAVSVGWGWGYTDVSVGPMRPTEWDTPTCCRRNAVLGNHIYRCMMVLHDGGGIYTLGAMEGTVIAGNVIHHSSGLEREGANRLCVGGRNIADIPDNPNGDDYARLGAFPGGIYLDEGSRGIEVYGNLFWATNLPLFYHNQIDHGYTMIHFHDNFLQIRPGTPEFPEEVYRAAGPRKNVVTED